MFGLDEAWFDTQSIRMSAPTIARVAYAPTTAIMHMGRWKLLPAAMRYQEQSTELNDSIQHCLVQKMYDLHKNMHECLPTRPFTGNALRQLPAHHLLEYLVMFVSYCAYDLQCNVRSIPFITSAVRKGMLLRSVNCDVFDSDL